MKHLYLAFTLLITFLVKTMLLPTGITDGIIIGFLSMLSLGLLWLEHNKKHDPIPELMKEIEEIKQVTSGVVQMDAKFEEKIGKLEAKINHFALQKSTNPLEPKIPKFHF